MVFSSLQFLFFFLPVVLLGYSLITLIKGKYLNIWLLIVSLFFYYLGAKKYLVLLLSVIVITYLSGMILSKNKTNKKFILFCSIASMLAVMGYYKYYNFVIDNINVLFSANYDKANIILPIGISFFIFQAISYIVDVYRGEQHLKNIVDVALYISFFPQLIAGPIIRFHNIKEYLSPKCRTFNIDNITNGIWRFCIGLCKKVLLANNLGALSNIVFTSTISDHSILYTWLGAVAYTLQIYFDFSGYSDMAIGLGKIFGFEFQENFNYPYSAKSIKDFWRRWHISLSQFFRDYVYIPCGGNRCSYMRWVINMLIVWFLTGMWHGASWNYICWGGVYGILLIVENKASSLFPSNNITSFLSHIYTLLTVIVLWVIFRTNSWQQALSFIANMFALGNKELYDEGFSFLAQNYAIVLICSVMLSFPVIPIVKKKLADNKVFNCISSLLLMFFVIMSISFIYMGSYNPFLYFMF